MTQHDTSSLTGLWQGQFTYPRGYAPEFFTASLLDQAGVLSGAITEKATETTPDHSILYAVLSGHHTGRQVVFVKTYEGTVRAHDVHYSGTVNDDATEISGTWSISGNWSGQFLMIREGQATQDEALLVEAEI
ncbi:hypothetical protein AA0312_1804 [Acetobacter tropicalis NRIC 0312]|uniref:DUF1579 domain-containing protein n=1 Tax=Acetobacter tropicalis TaxID=104102 RepID=A0A511FLZ5_9PROT|nr:hypothetical protein [Acetobacter tropicalis]KXV46104.1 hypothetical protein AD944_14000 [Acetobacter tropicalis]GAL96696.1 conserved hypothetical protein [Acetobacter tropicalis]GBR70362.1 hypothetical protein AA0312_1804 [Acetobacter tropicalis NRIC 0312]GEL49584.1 hypothetical protein ATR01nite_06590 [Acetobacter tropicalis]